MSYIAICAAALFLSLVVWVGGAITGQFMLARARARRDNVQVVLLVEQVRWLITHVYIPAGAVAFVSGVGLALATGTPLTAWYVVLPLLMYVGLAFMGGLYSLPEYTRLVKAAGERGVSDPEWHQRLWKAAWVNRIELALFAAVFVAVIAQIST